jgi:cyclic pyranopterin phosphate synthase
MRAKNLSHLTAAGQAAMVDVGEKPKTEREAVAAGRILLQEETLKLLQQSALPKGNAIETARLAGIMAAKHTAELIPLCHPLGLDFVDVQITPAEKSLEIQAVARCHGQTGVEMEALTAVSVAALTLYDMCKAVDKMMMIGDIRLISKSGGRSGDFYSQFVSEELKTWSNQNETYRLRTLREFRGFSERLDDVGRSRPARVQ